MNLIIEEYLKEIEYMRFMVIQKFIDKELDEDGLRRMLTHLSSTAYQAGRKHEEHYNGGN